MRGIDILIAAAGAGIGAAVTYFVMKKKLNDKAKEIEDIRDMYNERVRNIEKSRAAIDAMNEKKAEIMQDIEKKVEEQKLANDGEEFFDYSSISRKKAKENAKVDEPPIRFISESEAQQFSKDYELIGLTLYEDDVLTDDETENIIAASEFPYWIGENGIENIRNTFGNNEGVYILNEDRKAIYDITVLDERFGDDYEPVTIH